MRGDRGSEGNRENWGRDREDWRENDYNRESRYSSAEERNRGGGREEGYDARQRYGQEYERQRGGYSGQGQFGNEGRSNESRSNEGGFNQSRGYNPSFEGSRGYESGRGFEGGSSNYGNYGGARGYEGNRGFEGSRGFERSGGHEGGTQGNETRQGSYGSEQRGDYGPRAFTRQFQSGPEYFGTGQRGYGTTWGGSNAGYSGMGSGSGYQGGTGQYGDQGRYAGRGPKGYQRSDDRIKEDICERLTHHPEIDASEIEIQVKEGQVTLTGSVDRREDKRLAEDISESVSGVKDVHNQLRQHQHAMAGQTTGQSGQGGQGTHTTQGGTSTKK